MSDRHPIRSAIRPAIQPEFSRPFMVERHGAPLQDFAIDANAAERAALARRFGILSLESLHAEGSLENLGDGQGALLTARLTARVTQACVVTLEPVAATIDESFTLEYAAEGGEAPGPRELDIDPEEKDPPEPLVNGTIDVGEAVAEHLALSLDPYPRAPEARFTGSDEPDKGEDSPFKALSGLVKKDRS